MERLLEQIITKGIKPSSVLVSKRSKTSKNTWYYVVFGMYKGKIVGYKYLNKIPTVRDKEFNSYLNICALRVLVKVKTFGNFALDGKQLSAFEVVKKEDYLIAEELKRNIPEVYWNLISYREGGKNRLKLKVGSVYKRRNANFYSIVIWVEDDKWIGTNITMTSTNKELYLELMKRVKEDKLMLYQADIKALAEKYEYISTLDIRNDVLKLRLLGRF